LSSHSQTYTNGDKNLFEWIEFVKLILLKRELNVTRFMIKKKYLWGIVYYGFCTNFIVLSFAKKNSIWDNTRLFDVPEQYPTVKAKRLKDCA